MVIQGVKFEDSPLTGEASKTTKIAICIFLVVATFAAYSQVQDHEFLNYDDNRYVTKNVNVKAGLTSKSISWAFTTLHDGHWFPMTWLSPMLDYQLYGLHPKGHLLTNLFFHIANAPILFMVLLRMTGALWQSRIGLPVRDGSQAQVSYKARRLK